jgi:amphi-Trp domain-containing protein
MGICLFCVEMEIKKSPVKDRKIVEGEFSQEFYMDRNELAVFLRNLADQVEGEDDIKITSEDWILPFKPAGHAKVDIDVDEDELEIEIEFKKNTGKLSATSADDHNESDEEDSEDEETEDYEPVY